MSEYAWPVPGYPMTTPFGKKGAMWRACGYHTGIDIAAPFGTPIVAIEDGDVRSRNYGDAFGTLAFALSPDADHEWFYAHVSWRVANGTRVKKGQVIAHVGHEGNATGDHLHLEYHSEKLKWSCGVMRDPMNLLTQQQAPKADNNWQFPAGHKVYQKYLRFDGHEQNKDRTSDSIKALQEMLNKHKMEGGANIPITGRYYTATDREVRLCQSLHIPPADAENKSFIGPKQWNHLKESTGAPYELIEGVNAVTDAPAEEAPAASDYKWFVPPSILKLLSEVNTLWPNRSRTSDGTIGDYAHSQSKSEHNPVGHPFGPEFGTPGAVHAVDITADNPEMVGAIMRAAIGDERVWYVIHNRYIYSRTHGWDERPYNGGNPHATHIHISLRSEDKDKALFAENSTERWIVPVAAPDPEPAPAPVNDPVLKLQMIKQALQEIVRKLED